MTLGLYVHIPFCLRKCNYCDFLSGASTASERGEYLKALEQDIQLESKRLTISKREVHSVFFGGGTPTVLEAEALVNILSKLREYFIWNQGTEVTVEANPGTITLEKLRTLKSGGFNRLSLGVQSFNFQELQSIGRQHSLKDIYNSYHLIREAGFTNVNLDLIYALPGQALESWQENLQRAVELQPEHISAYGLKIEPGTILEERLNQGLIQETDEDLNDEMYQWTIEYLTSMGYLHYEISNFSLSDKESRHNLGYWQQEPYLGFGLGATSYLNQKRWTKSRNFADYQCLTKCAVVPVEEEELLSDKEAIEEAMFLGLRLTEGIDLKTLGNRYNLDLEARFQSLIEELIISNLLERKGSRIRLSSKGLSLGNQVFMAFLDA